MPSLKIAVVGAGIGGLTAAVALQQKGHSVTVFEKDSEVRALGAGLSLFSNAIQALEMLGLESVIPQTEATFTRLTATGQRTPKGSWLLKLPEDTTATLTVVTRPQLHEALRSRLSSGSLISGAECELISAEQGILSYQIRSRVDAESENSLGLATAAGSAETAQEQFDFIVAADGIHSDFRARLGLDPGLKYCGYTAWRGITNHPVEIGEVAGASWGSGEHFGYAPLNDGRIYWFATATAEANSSFKKAKTELLTRFSNWHNPIAELIEATDENTILQHDIYSLKKPLKTFVCGRVLLLGDAAHAMAPNLGQGAAQAIEDAAVLAALIPAAAEKGEFKALRALESYNRIRRPRAQGFARRANLLASLSQIPNPIVVFFRNSALRLAPNWLVKRVFARMHQFFVPR